jgi:thiol-disulfide isomerase/thioredoxin
MSKPTLPPLPRRHLLAGALALVAGGAPAARAQAPDGPRQTWPPRKPTPALVLPRHEGPPWKLADARGSPVLLNFWASWCEPCRSEMPSLELLQQRHQPQGLQILTVNYRETDAAVGRFIESTGLGLPVLRDRDGAAAKAFGVRIFPTTVAVSRAGRAAFLVVGEVDWAEAAARQWLAELV